MDTASELAGFIRAAGLDQPDLAVVGHSWGGMVTAHLPAVGLAPSTLILLDPPVLTLERLRALTESPTERDYSTLNKAEAAVRRMNPDWSERDVEAKARALTEFNPELVLAVLLQNGDWDGGMAALRDPAAAGSSAWLVRGEWDTGGFIPDSRVARIEAQLGADRVITIAGGPHSPQRTHPEATVRGHPHRARLRFRARAPVCSTVRDAVPQPFTSQALFGWRCTWQNMMSPGAMPTSSPMITTLQREHHLVADLGRVVDRERLDGRNLRPVAPDVPVPDVLRRRQLAGGTTVTRSQSGQVGPHDPFRLRGRHGR